MRAWQLSIALLLSTASGACSFHARGPEDYRKATRALLEGQDATIRTCYEGLLQTDDKSAGSVVVRFTVQKETGQIVDAKVLEAQSTASEALGTCVVNAISGLALDPPDARDGDATFTWEFRAKPAAAAPTS